MSTNTSIVDLVKKDLIEIGPELKELDTESKKFLTAYMKGFADRSRLEELKKEAG